MSPEELIPLIAGKQTVCIIGKSATGKTYLSDYIKSALPDFVYIHSDDYMEYGYEHSLYAMMDAIDSASGMPMVIEGIQVYRLLRKWAEQGKQPDLIIETLCTGGQRVERYIARRESFKLAHLETFDHNLNKIWADYVAIARDKMPELIQIRTDQSDLKVRVDPKDPRHVDYIEK